MSQFNLPLEIDYQPFQSTDLAGQGPYLAGYPAIMGAMGNATYTAASSDLREVFDTSLYGIPPNTLYQRKPWIFICKGPQVCYAAPGKAFVKGCDIRIYNRNAVALTKSVVAARVISYDVKTGLLWFDVYSIFMGADNGTGDHNRIATTDATATIFNGKQTINQVTGYPRTIATGGTAGSSDRDALTQLGSRNIVRVAEYFNDFVSPAEGPIDTYSNVGTRLNLFGNASVQPLSHPGTIRMQATSTNQLVYLTISPNLFSGVDFFSTIKNASFATLDGSYTEFCIYIPTLSNGTNEYYLTFGIYAGGSGSPKSQALFQYIRPTSSNWLVTSSSPGGGTNNLTTTTAVAVGWNKFRLTRNGSNYVFSINGVTIGTIGYPVLSDSSVYAIASPYVSIQRAAGTSPIIEVDYVYTKVLYATDRGL